MMLNFFSFFKVLSNALMLEFYHIKPLSAILISGEGILNLKKIYQKIENLIDKKFSLWYYSFRR